MTEQADRRRELLGDDVCAVAFNIGFNAPAPPPDVAARITALLAAAAVPVDPPVRTSAA